MSLGGLMSKLIRILITNVLFKEFILEVVVVVKNMGLALSSGGVNVKLEWNCKLSSLKCIVPQEV